MANSDPFYNRKPVPNEFIDGVGYSGLSSAEETVNRERKFSTPDGGDLRRFSNPKAGGKLDPFYQRKPVPDSLIQGIGETGLSKEQEYINRERKFSTPDGGDLRKFSNPKLGGKPDPFYQRKPLDKAEIDGVGDTQMSRAEEFETRENKASLFDLSADPFQLVSGKGHRQSIAGDVSGAAAADQRRRSSVAPNMAAIAAANSAAQNNQYSSTSHADKITPSSTSTGVNNTSANTEGNGAYYGTAGAPGATAHDGNPLNLAERDGSGIRTGETGHTAFHEATTYDDPDAVAPDEIR